MKYKVGDRVRCIKGNQNAAGMGWRKGLEFTITKAYEGSQICYFGGLDGNGVYEPYLELVIEKIVAQEPEIEVDYNTIISKPK